MATAGAEPPECRTAARWGDFQRLTEQSDERILAIIGAGHVPILRHAIQASPQYELIELSDVLAKRSAP